QVVVTGTCGSDTKSAMLTVQANTTTTALSNQTVCQGTSATFSTTASGTGPFSYAWTLDAGAVSGATTTSTSVTIATGSLSTGAHTVQVVVTGTCGSATRSATLTVNTPTATTALSPLTVCQGTAATFSTTASGTGPFSYAWTLDGGAVSGATTTS